MVDWKSSWTKTFSQSVDVLFRTFFSKMYNKKNYLSWDNPLGDSNGGKYFFLL